MRNGLIVKAVSGFFYVRPDDDRDAVVSCKARGLFKKRGIAPLVGDRVLFERKTDGSGEGTVVDVLPRRTELVRPPVANVDAALIVFAVTKPELNRALLDKFLAMSGLAGLESVICLTKADCLAGSDAARSALRGEIEIVRSVYGHIGYPVVLTSVVEGTGLEELMALLEGRITVVAGQSGVGKSSLLNALVPGLQLETDDISLKLGRGRHTTRHVELYNVGQRGMMADTPGFSQLELPEVEPEQLAPAFPEFSGLPAGCKFRGCLHLQEPGCRVISAVGSGVIDASRYEHYALFVKELRDRKRRY